MRQCDKCKQIEGESDNFDIYEQSQIRIVNVKDETYHFFPSLTLCACCSLKLRLKIAKAINKFKGGKHD